MWPILLDMTKEESMRHLRSLEIDAFSSLVNALRAQGSLDNEKLKLLRETGNVLHISQERHKAEIRRVVNDERLTTIAYHINGEKHSMEEWTEEGQRIIPLMARMVPQTAYAAIADEVADTACKLNKQLPMPASTERKRPVIMSSPTQSNPSTSESSNKNLQFRLAEQENKKRKLSVNLDGPLAQHLMAPPKISKIQQIYRQKTKTRQKDQLVKLKPTQEMDQRSEYIVQHVAMTPVVSKQNQQLMQTPKTQPKLMINQLSANATNNGSTMSSGSSPKINILQNISIPLPPLVSTTPLVSNVFEEPNPDAKLLCDKLSNKHASTATVSSSTSANFPRNIIKPSSSQNLLSKSMGPLLTGSSSSSSNATWKTLPSKTVTTTSGQKLIVVTSSFNTQSLTQSPSILQRTLTTIPFKNISMKTFDKFKIVSTSNSGGAQPIHLQNARQKVVTVRTSNNKKIIPLSQVQVLNTKGGIKVLPIGGKLISKSTSVGNSVYLTTSSSSSTTTNFVDYTKSTSSTPLLMSTKPQEEVSVLSGLNSRLNSDSNSVAEECNKEAAITSECVKEVLVVEATSQDQDVVAREEEKDMNDENCHNHNDQIDYVNNEIFRNDHVELENNHCDANDPHIEGVQEVVVEEKMDIDGSSYYLLESEDATEVVIDGQPLEVLLGNNGDETIIDSTNNDNDTHENVLVETTNSSGESLECDSMMNAVN